MLSRETMQSDDYESTDHGELDQMETMKENETPLNLNIPQKFEASGKQQKSYADEDNTSSLSMQTTSKLSHVPQRVTVSTKNKQTLTNHHSKCHSRDRSKKK